MANTTTTTTNAADQNAIQPEPPANTTASKTQAAPVTRTGNYNIFNGGKIRIDLTNTKYKVLRECALEMKWKVITAKKRTDAENQASNDAKALKKDVTGKHQNENSAVDQSKKDEVNRHANVDIIWNDVTIPSEKLSQLKSFQKVNHFPSMNQVTKKSNLASSLKKMKNQYPIDFGFYPKTWIIPHQMQKLKSDMAKEKAKDGINPVMIVKPSESCQGKGIFFINDLDKLRESLQLDTSNRVKNMAHTNYVVQRYIPNPYLLDGLKFDLRLYVLVTSCHPLTIFWHKEGIARFATQPYSLKQGKGEMPEKAHLTNYAINKDAADFKITEQDIQDGTSSKRTLDTVYKRLADDGVDVNLLKLKIADLIIKTLISCQPDLLHNYRTCQPNDRTFDMCFEVLGFDVLIDADTKPWLLEVNQAPSFQTDSALDYRVKKAVIKDTFQILGVTEATRQKNLDRIIRDRELKKMHKQSTLFWNQMRGEEFAREIDDRRVHQLNHLGGFYKVFPVEDHDQSFSGGLFRNSISKKAKSYYSKFEKNGNMSVAASTGHGILQSIIKQKKHQHRNNVTVSNHQEQNTSHQVSSSSQVLPSGQLRMHNVTTNSSMFSMSQNQTFQMVNDGIANGHSLNKVMAQSGSEIKLRGMGGRQYQETGQAIKQKVFSLPRDVNGVASITQARPLIENIQAGQNELQQQYGQESNVAQANKSHNNTVGPLVLNQVINQGNKRHVSVDPNTGKNQKTTPALIPNGMNNGRVYRRQSSDQHQQLGQSQLLQQQQQQQYTANQLQTAGLQLNDPTLMMMQTGQNQQSLSMNKQDKANAWVRRMRFVMAQATQQNYVGDASQVSPMMQPQIGENTQLSNGATIHQVITQLQNNVNSQGQQSQNQILIQHISSNKDTPHQASNWNSSNANHVIKTTSTPAQQLIQHNINTIQKRGDAEITLADLKGAGAAPNQQSLIQHGPPGQNQGSSLEHAGGKNQGNRSKNNSNVSIQAVKQIKAEAFKSYLSQATQLQQKILEHSIQQQQQQVSCVDQAGIQTVISDFSALRPSSQDNLDGNGNGTKVSYKNTNRTKTSDMQLNIIDSHANNNILSQTSPAHKKHMTPQVLKNQLSPKDNHDFPSSENNTNNGRANKNYNVGKSAGPVLPKTNNSMLPEVQNSLTNTVQSTANPSTNNLHQSVKFPRTNLKYSESQQVPSENQQRIYWLDSQKNAVHQHLEIEQRSHPSLQLHLSPVNAGKARGVADFHHRKTVQGPGTHSTQFKINHEIQSPKNTMTNGVRPASFKFSNLRENAINAEVFIQTHPRVQEFQQSELQQPASMTASNLAQQHKTSQSQMQHFQKKSASVPAGQAIHRAANTTGTMPSIHKQIALPNLKSSHNKLDGPSAINMNANQQQDISNIKNNHIQIMQNTASGSERNQLLLVSNPDLILKKSSPGQIGNQYNLSLPSPMTTSVKPKETRTTGGSSGSNHMKAYSIQAISTTPTKRSFDGRSNAAAAAVGQGGLPSNAATNNKDNSQHQNHHQHLSAQPN